MSLVFQTGRMYGEGTELNRQQYIPMHGLQDPPEDV